MKFKNKKLFLFAPKTLTINLINNVFSMPLCPSAWFVCENVINGGCIQDRPRKPSVKALHDSITIV